MTRVCVACKRIARSRHGRAYQHFHAVGVRWVCHACWRTVQAFADRLRDHTDGADRPLALFTSKSADDRWELTFGKPALHVGTLARSVLENEWMWQHYPPSGKRKRS